MKLYEIDEQITALIDPETGEITDYEKLGELQIEREAKIESLACYYKDLQGDAEKIKAEIERLKGRLEATTKSCDSLKNYLSSILAGQKYKTAKVDIGWRKSTKVVIDDASTITDERFLKIKTTTEISKTALLAAISSGETVTGAHLEDSNNIQIK